MCPRFISSRIVRKETTTYVFPGLSIRRFLNVQCRRFSIKCSTYCIVSFVLNSSFSIRPNPARIGSRRSSRRFMTS